MSQGSSIAPELLWPLPLTMLGFTAIFASVALMRMRAELARQKLEARLRRSVEE
jgi:heme exporter protein C